MKKPDIRYRLLSSRPCTVRCHFNDCDYHVSNRWCGRLLQADAQAGYALDPGQEVSLMSLALIKDGQREIHIQ